MVIDNVVINKSQAIERCLKRVEAEYNGRQINLFENITKQDSIILNLQRACELSLDLATHIIKIKHLSIPHSSRDTFEILAQAKLLPENITHTMKCMVGFRNIAIHEYQKLNLDIVKAVIEDHLNDIREFIVRIKAL